VESGFAKIVGASIVLAALVTTIPYMLTTTRDVTAQVLGENAPQSTQIPPPPESAAPPAAGNPHAATDWTWAINAAVILAAIIVVAAIGAGAWWASSARRARRREHAARRQKQLDRWAIGVNALNATSEALYSFETDPESVYFTRPLLGDVDEPATAAFHSAYAEAQNLRTDTAPADNTAIDEFVTAATAARRAFGKADDNARRKARQGIVHTNRKLTAAERRRVAQARNLMAQARDPSSTRGFSQTAHAKALDLLDAVGLTVPEHLVDNVNRSLEAVRREALTAG
jgi:hypothetical protein